jgi:hypothetical protein
MYMNFGCTVYFSRFGMLYQEKSGNPGTTPHYAKIIVCVTRPLKPVCNVAAIFALRTAPDPDEIKYELESIKDRIKSKPLPFLNSKGKKKKPHEASYVAPTYVPTSYDVTTTRPVTFSFDVDESLHNQGSILRNSVFGRRLFGQILILNFGQASTQ